MEEKEEPLRERTDRRTGAAGTERTEDEAEREKERRAEWRKPERNAEPEVAPVNFFPRRDAGDLIEPGRKINNDSGYRASLPVFVCLVTGRLAGERRRRG